MKRSSPITSTLSALLVTSLMLAGGCGFLIDEQVYGNGDVQSETRLVAEYTELETALPFPVTVQQGERPGVEITCDANLLAHIETCVRDGVFEVKVQQGYRLRRTGSCRAVITAARLESLSNIGSGKVEVPTTWNHLEHIALVGSGAIEVAGVAIDGRLVVEVIGSGDLSVSHITAAAVSARSTGSGAIWLLGSAGTITVDALGSGRVDTAAIASQDAEVYLAGSGSVHVFASQSADIELLGSGDVIVTGDPANVKQQILGSGSLILE